MNGYYENYERVVEFYPKEGISPYLVSLPVF